MATTTSEPSTGLKLTPPKEQHRLAVYQAMTPALRALADSYRVTAMKESKNTMLWRWDWGSKVREAMDDEPKFGVRVAQQLSEYLGLSVNTVYALRNLPDAFSREDIEAMSQRETVNGATISASHLIALAQLKKVTDRKKLLERIFNEDLSYAELLREITAAGLPKQNAAKTPENSGRKVSVPTSPLAAAQQVISVFQTINKRFEGWDKILFLETTEMPPAKISKILLSKLQDAQLEMKHTQEQLIDGIEKLTASIHRVSDVLSAGPANTDDAGKPGNLGKSKKGK